MDLHLPGGSSFGKSLLVGTNKKKINTRRIKELLFEDYFIRDASTLIELNYCSFTYIFFTIYFFK